MMAFSDLAVFVAALVAVYLLPGPDMALVLTTSAQRGPRVGVLAAAGLALSRTLHVTLAALGLAALFHAHPLLFDGVRGVGAAYLAWLGWKVWRAEGLAVPAAGSPARDGLAALRRGFLTNLLNPKALMFCALLLPQFIDPRQALAPQYLLLGVILVGLGLLFDLAYVAAAVSLARRLSASRAVGRMARALFAGVFGVAAVRLAVGGD